MRPNHHIPTRPTTMTMTTPGGSAARRTAGTSACRSAGSSRPSRYNPPPPKAGPLCIIYSISLCVGIYVGVGVWMSSTTYIATPPAPRHTPTVTVTKPQRHRQKGAADPLDAAAQHRERASLHGALRGLGPVLLPKGGYIHIICVIAEGGDGPAGECMYNGVWMRWKRMRFWGRTATRPRRWVECVHIWVRFWWGRVVCMCIYLNMWWLGPLLSPRR